MLPAPAQNAIQALIASRGEVSFRDFMELALYHPRHGYYASARATLGREGDYFTSVSVGKIFGQLLAAQFQEMWERLGHPAPFTIVEQGAHDGTFAADVLGWCQESTPDFFKVLEYAIVEPLAPLRAKQQTRLAEFSEKLTLRNTLEDLPPFTGVHFSNELLDAFPAHRVRFRNGEWRELYVTPDLTWTDRPINNDTLLNSLVAVPSLEGYTTEVNLEARQWATRLAARINRGWALMIDYGYPRHRYYSPDRRDGTLQSYAAHRKVPNPLENPGFQDLTTHVEFTSLAEAFVAAGMQIAAYTDQHHFLTGLLTRAFATHPPTPAETRALKTLLHPEMLGTTFQVLCASRTVPSQPLSGLQYARDWHPELLPAG
jgi:SAM-dependent MidA family methyltransferase